MLLPQISGTGIALNNSGSFSRVNPKSNNAGETRNTFLSSKSIELSPIRVNHSAAQLASPKASIT